MTFTRKKSVRPGCGKRPAYAVAAPIFFCASLCFFGLAQFVCAEADESESKKPVQTGAPLATDGKKTSESSKKEATDVAEDANADDASVDEEKVSAEVDKLLAAGKTDAAIEMLQTAIRDEPRSASLREKLGQCFYLIGSTSKAIDEMKKAVVIAPRESSYHADLAWLYTRAGNYSDAIHSANAAISLEPEKAYPYVLLGFAYGSTNRRDQAVASLQKALEIEPENVTALVYLGDVLLARGDFPKAVEAYNKALKIDNKIVGAHIGLGNSYGKLGEQGKQIASYKEAVKVAPRDPDAHGHLGFALSQTGDLIGGMKEGFVANSMRVNSAWDKFMGMFVAVWAGIFIVFGTVFGALFLGSNFKPQPGETLLKSFLLTFHKERPGRLVVTNRRVVYVPELFSKSFGATRLSIERDEITDIEVGRNSNSGSLTIKSTSDTVHTFRMPTLVLDPVVVLLKNEGLIKNSDATSGGGPTAEAPVPSLPEPDETSQPPAQKQSEEDQFISARFDFRPKGLIDEANSESAAQDSGEQAKPGD